MTPVRYRAAVMEGPGTPVALTEYDAPTLEPGAMLMEPLFAEVCGTDVHLSHGRLAGVPYPIIPGHVSIGRIMEISGSVTDMEGNAFSPGDMVTFLDVHETCGNCYYCLVAKAATRCPSRKVYGITYSSCDGLLGGWSERVYLKPGVKTIRIPEKLSPETFIGGGCGAPTAFHAVQRAGIRMNDAVLVQGSGPVGLSAVAFARISGAGTIIVIGAPADRLTLAKAMGADETISLTATTAEERTRRIRDMTGGRGTDVTIEATGNPAAIPEGMTLTRDQGTYVIVGQYTDCGNVEINPHTMINRKHLDVRGCWGSDYSHFHGAVQAMARHGAGVPWHRLAAWQYPLELAAEALADVEAQRVPKAVIRVAGRP
ncbi:MAG: zinc-binding dehydrogenase [Candidatus Sumerlaeaceae bacterium]|nr:zinc-binding dehydrogenase [Candidatus Sumerlaeaceae bacterium]